MRFRLLVVEIGQTYSDADWRRRLRSPFQRSILGLALYAALMTGTVTAQKSEHNRIAVATAQELVSATSSKEVTEITVSADLTDLPSVRLMPGQTLHSSPGRHVVLSFRPDVDGLQLTTDNSVIGLDLRVTPTHRAIWNDRTVNSLGTLVIRSVQTVGFVQVVASDKVRSGRAEVDGLDIRYADTRAERERPQAYGVSVLQGAFTLWNLQPDDKVVITADLINLSVGRFESPVLGGGIFVGGERNKGGRLRVERLETNAVYSDGRIAPGTADQITGGVFVVYGAYVDSVRNLGPVTTYGANDMALDNWGTVDRWNCKAKVTTHGVSGIGFVNFGTIRDLHVEEPIETFGQGARGFNVYDGTVNRVEFDRIVTHGDGAVGIQISQPIGTLSVRRGIETFGGTGPSLVKGVVQSLSATPLSIKPGGSAYEVAIEGGIETHGTGIAPLEVLGNIQSLRVEGGVRFAGH